jgi:hypothetical protein
VDEAKANYQMAVNADPESPIAQHNLAARSLHLADFPGARDAPDRRVEHRQTVRSERPFPRQLDIWIFAPGCQRFETDQIGRYAEKEFATGLKDQPLRGHRSPIQNRMQSVENLMRMLDGAKKWLAAQRSKLN